MSPSNYSEQRLVDRCAVVTGAGHGIGRAYARRLGAEGAQVVVAEVDQQAGETVARELVGNGIEAIALRTDVADGDSVKATVERATQAFGKVDILVNNAAMYSTFPVLEALPEELPLEHFEQVLRVNVLGSWLCASAVIPGMRRRGYGKIINISSGTVFKGSGADMLQYVTSKSAILGFTRTLARALGPSGIRVNCVAPGFTVTKDDPTAEEMDEALQRARAERALARVETPEDLVGVVSFLASADSDFITGQTIVVDGGAFLH